MRWWPVAATISATIFILSLAGFAVAPSIVASCAQIGGSCEEFPLAARSLVTGSGAFFAASLVAGLYTALLAGKIARGASETDARPLVSVHARRRP